MGARKQIVEALGLDPDWNDPDEYSFADLLGEVRAAGEALTRERSDGPPARIGDALSRIADALDLPNDPELTPAHLVRHVEQLRAERDAFREALHDALVPLDKRARKLAVDDLLYDRASGRLATVQSVEVDAFGVTCDLLSHSSGSVIRGKRFEPLDREVTVLAELPVRDGMLLLRKSLGAQLVDATNDTPDVEGDTLEPEMIEGAWDVGKVHSCALLPHPHVAFSACVKYALDHGDQTYVGKPAG